MCMICKFGLSQLMSMVEDHKDAIKMAMKKLCSLFPEAFEDQCKSMVDTYITIMIDMLDKGAMPEMICETIGLCDKADAVPKIKHQDSLIARSHHEDDKTAVVLDSKSGWCLAKGSVCGPWFDQFQCWNVPPCCAPYDCEKHRHDVTFRCGGLD